jgi:hypothetical protein
VLYKVILNLKKTTAKTDRGFFVTTIQQSALQAAYLLFSKQKNLK